MDLIHKLLNRAQTPEMDLPELFGYLDQLSAANPQLRLQLIKTWIAFHSDHPLMHLVLFNYGGALHAAGDTIGAITVLVNAIKAKPEYAPAYVNIANYFEATGRLDLAIKALQNLFEVVTDITSENISFKTLALNQTGRIHQISRNLAEAEACFDRSLSINDGQLPIIEQWINVRQAQIKWPLFGEAPSSISSKQRLAKIPPLLLAYYVDDPIFQLANAYRYNKEVLGWSAGAFINRNDYSLPENGGRIKIGYISSDFRVHAVGYSIAEVIELHDRTKFEIYCYYCGRVRNSDDTQQRIQASADHWLDVYGMDDATLARRIKEDGIQIQIDLNGYTMDARTAVFGLRPAPINVNWFGYPGTMGSPYHHYIIADDVVIPTSHEQFYSEKVVRLPCYQPNDRKRSVAPRAPSRAEMGLPYDAFVFCSFNGLQKLNLATFTLWMDILNQLPDSVLWLLGDTATANERLLALAETFGVARDRLVFAEKLPNPEHLARYPLADLFLDSMPYGAHTTAADSLWMGVPILTVAGGSFPARVCSSILHAAGISELVMSNQEEYVQKAISLGKDPEKIKPMRQHLLDNRGSCLLFNTPLLVSKLETLFEQMWAAFLNKELPKPNLDKLDIFGQIADTINHEDVGLLNWRALANHYESALGKTGPLR